jgi:hypothetical protein
MKRTNLGLVSMTLVASLAVACGDDEPATTTSAETDTTAGDGDGDTGDGDGDGDTGDGDGDGDGDPGDGDGDADTDEPDMDMDGVADGSDNCPDIANPNQLDYDENGTGNVCDTQVFSTVGGTLDTTALADAGIVGMCEIPLTITVTGGQVMVQLDDDAAVAAFVIGNLQVADILDQECQLAVTATVSMTNFMITNSGDPFPVSMAHSLAMHDAGQIAGMSDIPHPVLSTATLSASINGDPPMDSELMLDGALPIFTANITGGGAMGTMSFADAQFVLAMDQFMIEDPFPITIDFSLTGLVGTLTLAP